MRGIAMAILFFAWLYEYHNDKIPSEGFATLLGLWFVATVIIIAVGW